MTDYDLFFKDMAESSRKHVGSLTSLSMCQMVRNETGDGVKLGELARKYGHKLGKSTHKF